MTEKFRNIDTEAEFNKVRIEYNCEYTLDDFIEIFRISERSMKDLLKGIDHISISKSLYLEMKKKYGDSIKRQQFYNHEQVFKELVESKAITFKLNYMAGTFIDGEYVRTHNEVTSNYISPNIVFNYKDYLYWLIEIAGSTSDVGKIFKGEKRQLNREVKKMEGIEIIIGKNIKRYMPLMVEYNKMDATIAYVLMEDIIRERKVKEFQSFIDQKLNANQDNTQ